MGKRAVRVIADLRIECIGWLNQLKIYFLSSILGFNELSFFVLLRNWKKILKLSYAALIIVKKYKNGNSLNGQKREEKTDLGHNYRIGEEELGKKLESIIYDISYIQIWNYSYVGFMHFILYVNDKLKFTNFWSIYTKFFLLLLLHLF